LLFYFGVSRQEKWHSIKPLVRRGIQVFSCIQENRRKLIEFKHSRSAIKTGLIRPAGYFNQVVAELGLYRAVDFCDLCTEDDFVEFRDHLALRKFAQVTALFAGRAL
jgi:hypothetical protein